MENNLDVVKGLLNQTHTLLTSKQQPDPDSNESIYRLLGGEAERKLDLYRASGEGAGKPCYFGSFQNHWAWKKGQMNAMLGYMNQGKSQVIRELLLLTSIVEGRKHACFVPENAPAHEFYEELIHTYIGKPVFHKEKDKMMSNSEYRNAKEFVHEHFFFVYPKRGTKRTPNVIYDLFSDCKAKFSTDSFLVDNLNNMSHNIVGNEANYWEEFYDELKMFIVEQEAYYIQAMHMNKPDRIQQGENFPEPNIYAAKGGSMHGNKLDNCLWYNWTNYNTNRMDTEAKVFSQKVKKPKLTGVSGGMTFFFDPKSARYHDGQFNYFIEQAQMIARGEDVRPLAPMPINNFYEPPTMEF